MLAQQEILVKFEETSEFQFPAVDIPYEALKRATVFFGDEKFFKENFGKILAERCPEWVAKYPGISLDTRYGYIGGVALSVEKQGVASYWVGLPGARHADVEQYITAIYGPDRLHGSYTKGFITNCGRVVRRIPARAIAVDAGQLKKGAAPHPELYSDDIW